jgi:hypothetical protein
MDAFLQYASYNRTDAEIDADLAELRRDLPQVQAVWEASAKRIAENDAAARLALAEQALAAAPHQAWPYLAKAGLLAADPEAARAVLDAGLAAIPAVMQGQRARLLLRRAELRADAVGLADVDEARRLGAPEGEVQRLRAAMLTALGRPAEAAAAAWAWSLARPDDIAAVARLFEADAMATLGLPRIFGRLHDMAGRNPHHSARRLEALRRHAGPGGSPVLALSHALALDRGSPDDPYVIQGRRLRRHVVAGIEKLGRIADIDLPAHHIVLDRPDGIRVEAAFHPVSGRLTRYTEGTAWMAATWDATGTRLLELSDSAGGALTLTWEGPRLAALSGRGDDPFGAELDGDGSARRIAGRPAAYDAAVRVIAQWIDGDLARVPELSHRRPVLERLRAAEAKGGDDAVLATAAWLVDHLGEGRGFGAEASRRLNLVLDRAMAAPARRAAGLRAAVLWHRLAVALWPGGLDLPAWERWNALRAWAAAQGPAARDFAAAIDNRPLSIAPAARWLARSWLGNPANWRLYPAEDVLPVDNHPPLAMIRRANGDLVVGTATGFSVLRSGRWQRYAYSPGQTRFLGEEAGDLLRAGPEVAAIAEDSTGALWLAAGDVLVRVAGPYDGMAEHWPLAVGGAPTLAAFGPGVLAAGPSGLLRFGVDGPSALPDGMQPLAASSPRGLTSVAVPGGEPMVLAAGRSGVAVWRDGQMQTLFDGAADAVLWLPAEGQLAVLAGGRVLLAEWKGDATPAAFIDAAQPDELQALGRPLGLGAVVDDGRFLPVVRGERGIAFLRDGHAELRQMAGPAVAITATRHAAWVAVPGGVWMVEEGLVVR